MQSFKDYHKTTWYYVEEVPSFWQSLKPTVLFLALLTLGCLISYAYSGNFTHLIDLKPLLLILGWLGGILLLLIVHTLQYIIRKSLGPKLLEYRIDETGLTLNRKHVPYSRLNLNSCVTMIGTQIPATLNRKDTFTPATNSKLSLPTRSLKPIHLHFTQEVDRQKALLALKHYCELN